MLNKKEFLIKVCKIVKDSPCGGMFLIFFWFVAAPGLPDFAIYILSILPLWAVGWALYEALAGNRMKSVCVAAAFSLSVYAFFYGASENIKTGVYAGVLLTYMWCGVLVFVRLLKAQAMRKKITGDGGGGNQRRNMTEMQPIIAGGDSPAGRFPKFWILLGLSMALVYAAVCVVVAEKWFSLTSLFVLSVLFGIVANWFFPVSKFSGGALMFDKPGDINTEARKGMRISLFFAVLLGVIWLDSRMLFFGEEGMHRDAVINLNDGFLLGKIWAITAAVLMIFSSVWFSIGRYSNERILWIRYVFSVSVILFGIFTWLLVYYLLGNEEPGARKYWFYSSIFAFGFFLVILRGLIYLLYKKWRGMKKS